jgi:hypothetical protein
LDDGYQSTGRKTPRNSPGDNIALLMSGSIPFQKTVELKHLFQGKN